MSFYDIGYARGNGLFCQTDIASAKQAIEEICESPGIMKGLKEVCYVSQLKAHRNPGLNPSDTSVPFIIGELPALSTSLKRIILNESLWTWAAELLGSDRVIYHFSNVTRKPAHIGPNITWHRDYPNQYICTRDSRHFFRVLIPLEAMIRENGCTEAVAQSHLISDEEAVRQNEIKCRIPSEETIALEVNPGDAVAIHSKLFHGGRENRSAKDRNLIVVQFGVETEDYLYRNAELYTGFNRQQMLNV
ncbi:MAG: phytanoyl-CoA dioxygenase family protein [Chthoniobacterales bacterium]